jgi:hypothetical protein
MTTVITLADLASGKVKLDGRGRVHFAKGKGMPAESTKPPRAPKAPAPAVAPRFALEVEFPLFTKSEANSRDVHYARAERVQDQRAAVGRVLEAHFARRPPLPATVTITRLGPRDLDSDNLASSAKATRDEIAAFLGIDDGSPLVTWLYAQARPATRGVYAIRIRIETGVPC